MEEGARVRSGSFRLARDEALAKLQRFQSKEPSRFLLHWLRAAVASRATRVDADVRDGALAFRFDGTPLTPELLSDPVAGLLGDLAAGGLAARHFSVGLVAALRFNPRRIELETGAGPDRRRVSAGAELELTAEAPAEPESRDTVLRLFEPEPAAALPLFLQALGEGCLLCPAEVRLQGEAVLGMPPGALGMRVPGGRRAWLGARRRRQPPRVRLACLGAELEPVEAGEIFRLFDAGIADDSLALDLSHDAAVHDASLSAALLALTDAAERFAYGQVAAHRAAFRKTGSLDLSTSAWVREAALLELEPSPSPFAPSLRKRLLKAPVLQSARGNPLSARRVLRLYHRHRAIPFAQRRLSPEEVGRLGFDPILLADDSDAAFVKALAPLARLDNVTPSWWRF